MPGCHKDGLEVAGVFRMAGRRPPLLAQSTFDNMGAEASTLRESLVNSKLLDRREIFANEYMKTFELGKLFKEKTDI